MNLRSIVKAVKTLGKFQIFGLVCGVYCAAITAALMLCPKLIALAWRLM